MFEKILSKKASLLDKELSKFVLGPILLDTVNLDPEFGRVQDKDIEVAKKLMPIAEVKDQKDQKEFFESLQFAKFDTSKLSTRDLLRKDYKEWPIPPDNTKNYGISSVLLSIPTWFAKETDFFTELPKFVKHQGISIIFVMHAFTDPTTKTFRRQLTFYSEDEKLFKLTEEALLKSDLQLEVIVLDAEKESKHKTQHISFYQQNNIKASRKQLQPLLDKIYSTPSH
eukprot:TRINITY_DN2609_c0_g1_i1.p1 TRINITY_DN2609_c0_g1~~TRINITY_DN2609_c0_g1_i1.p1  ORF type:complete len:248 (-),score=39.05 TRINITY_DN2609_c0_g1_i1:20-697(-)